MARVPVRKRKPAQLPSDAPMEVTPDSSMVIIRGPKNIKPPSPKELEQMRLQEFIRKNPHTAT